MEGDKKVEKKNIKIINYETQIQIVVNYDFILLTISYLISIN